jgi:hypothetical protein
MPNGKITLYNKITNDPLVELDIVGTFNIEDNLNDTPSNAKFKVVTSDTYREEFEVNTIVYHGDTDSWWVIKSDESTYINTGEYEHELQLVEYLEWFSYKHLPNCAFAPNTYTLEQMLNRLLILIGGTKFPFMIEVIYPPFLDKDKIMPFMSFENYTMANAIKNIARTINAIPKMYVDLGTGFVPTLTFINRSGLDNTIVNTLNTQFPVAFEKNMNSNDQFLTRSISNVTNAKSSNLVVAPKNGGFKNIVPNNIVFDNTNRESARVFAPSKIDKIEYVNVIVPISLYYVTNTFPSITNVTLLYRGYYLDKQTFIDAIENSGLFGIGQVFTQQEKLDAISRLPDVKEFYKVKYNQEIDKDYFPTNTTNSANLFFKKMNLLDKFGFDTASKIVGGVEEPDGDTKDRTIHWLPFTNEIIMPLSFRNGLSANNDHNERYYLLGSNGLNSEQLILVTDSDIPTNSDIVRHIFNEEVLIQIAYYPIADIKVSIDNDNDAQDEKFFNQSGKIIDAVSVSKLITSHTNDSVEGTKIRNARYQSPDEDFSDILPLGQIVRDNNQLYVISQRSIDANIRNGNEYYNVIYTLSRNRIARSENIIADSAVISYKTPDDNLVFRNQLYKDYIELSLQSIHNETPYLVLNKALSINSTLAGTDFDYTVLAKNDYGSTPTIARYVKNPTIFDLHKSKLMNINWQDNNVIGFRFNRTGGVLINTLVQTPIVYTDNLGKATDFELLFCNTNDIIEAREYYNDNFTPTSDLIPFEDLTRVDEDFYQGSIIDENNFSFRIEEPLYSKDPFEIPVFEYMVQANDDYNALGNIVVGNDLFTNFNGAFHYVINNTTRFTAENASDLWVEPIDQFQNSFIVTRSGTYQEILDLDLYADGSLFPLGRNEALIKNIGFYVKNGSNIKFLFAINDYVESGSNDKDDIRIFINNWKI